LTSVTSVYWNPSQLQKMSTPTRNGQQHIEQLMLVSLMITCLLGIDVYSYFTIICIAANTVL